MVTLGVDFDSFLLCKPHKKQSKSIPRMTMQHLIDKWGGILYNRTDNIDMNEDQDEMGYVDLDLCLTLRVKVPLFNGYCVKIISTEFQGVCVIKCMFKYNKEIIW